MYYVPGLKAFFCEKVTSDLCGQEVMQVSLNRIDPADKGGWPTDDTRPNPVLGSKEIPNQPSQNQKSRIILQEFESSIECVESGFANLGPSGHFSVYLTWDDYLACKPVDYLDKFPE